MTGEERKLHLRCSDGATKLEEIGPFNAAFEIVAMHGHPMVLKVDGMLGLARGAKTVLVPFPLHQLTSDALATDCFLLVPRPGLAMRA